MRNLKLVQALTHLIECFLKFPAMHTIETHLEWWEPGNTVWSLQNDAMLCIHGGSQGANVDFWKLWNYTRLEHPCAFHLNPEAKIYTWSQRHRRLKLDARRCKEEILVLVGDWALWLWGFALGTTWLWFMGISSTLATRLSLKRWAAICHDSC